MTIHDTFSEHAGVLGLAAESLPPVIEKIVVMLMRCFNDGGKLIVCGNGGSAADADHLVAELVGRYKGERRSLPAVALTTNGATITAIGNDYGFAHVFARQMDAVSQQFDVLLAISTSGNSPNVLAAVARARAREVGVIAFTGNNDSALAAMADIVLAVPSNVTARIQEMHTLCIHAICEALEDYK